MPIITFEAGHAPSPALTIDLGEADRSPGGPGYYSEGDLGAYGGNLYLFIDGVEYGSLFFVERDGRITIELGQYRDEPNQEWEPTNPLAVPVDGAGPLDTPGATITGGAR